MKVLKAGDLAYLDTIFSGLIPCRVESVEGRTGTPSTTQKIMVKLTADRGAFKRGEIIESSGAAVVPRSSVHTSYGQFYVVNDWQVQAD